MTKSNKELPRVERDEEDDYILLERVAEIVIGLRSALRLGALMLGFMFFILVGVVILVNRLDDDVQELEEVTNEARDSAVETSRDLEEALENSNDPERAQRLAQAFEVIFRIGAQLESHIQETGG